MAVTQQMQGVSEAVSAQEARTYRPPDTQLVHTVLSNLSTQIVQLTPRAGAFAETCLRTLVLLQARLSCAGAEAVEKHDELVVTPRCRSVPEPDEEPALVKQAGAKLRSHSAHAGKRLHRELPHRWSPQQLQACESILIDLEHCRMEMEDHRSSLAWPSLASPLLSSPLLRSPSLVSSTERPKSLPPQVIAEPPSPREMPAPGRLTLLRAGTARHSPAHPAPAKHGKETIVRRSKSAAVARHKRSSGRARKSSSEEEAARALQKARALLSDMLTQCADDDNSNGDGNCSITEALQEVQQQSARRHSSVPRHCMSPTNVAGHCLVSSSPGRCDASALQPLNGSMLGFYLEQTEGHTSQSPS